MGICQFDPVWPTWPQADSASANLVNRSHLQIIREICSNAGVKLLYLPPYSPGLNSIEEFFAELKAFVRRNWQKHTGQDSKDFLEWSLDIVGARGESTECHFRHANIEVKEHCIKIGSGELLHTNVLCRPEDLN